MFAADVKPVTKFVSTVALIITSGFWMPREIMQIKTADKILTKAEQRPEY
jgi:hypothetical protein